MAIEPPRSIPHCAKDNRIAPKITISLQRQNETDLMMEK